MSFYLYVLHIYYRNFEILNLFIVGFFCVELRVIKAEFRFDMLSKHKVMTNYLFDIKVLD
jgi:hypothetical protein